MANNPVLSVQKALDILDILTFEDPGRQGFRLSELSERTGIRPNTLHNLLKTMISGEYVKQLKNARYAAGVKIERIGTLSLLARQDLPGGLAEIMRRLRDEIGENVLFCVLSGGKWIRVLELASQGAIRVDTTVLAECNIYEKASGRVMIAYCSPQELSQVIERWGMPGALWNGIDTPQRLDDARQAIREAGCCEMLTIGESISALGVPVLTRDGKLIGCIGVYSPAFRCDADRKREIREKAFAAAAKMQRGIRGE
ncbi:MAG: helix-turn-helix domain-containing protein [Clostridiales bacterium]|nr:helix-turn-helix domain-containing protein [Clostridiales bacterium]